MMSPNWLIRVLVHGDEHIAYAGSDFQQACMRIGETLLQEQIQQMHIWRDDVLYQVVDVPVGSLALQAIQRVSQGAVAVRGSNKRITDTAGTCQLCSTQMDKVAMQEHLERCLFMQRDHSRQTHTSKKFQVLVEGLYLPEYWMHLEIGQHVRLSTLDKFLRSTWLECCGHLSAFIIHDQRYSSDVEEDDVEEDGEGDEQSMDSALHHLLTAGQSFFYEYDFGSTTRLSLTIVREYSGEPLRGRSVRLLARNTPLPLLCIQCGQPAKLVCTLCVDTYAEKGSYEQSGWFCQQHARKHTCGMEMMSPIVNSPRTGVCGYIG